MGKMQFTVVAIDGPCGSGKSTVSFRLAEKLGYNLIDTGAMFRIVGLLAVKNGVSPDDDKGLGRIADGLEISFGIRNGINRVYLSGRDITEDIRTPEISSMASKVSTKASVRSVLLKIQRGMAQLSDVVMEGRDVGTVVFPDAAVKFFLTATTDERARRRHAELQQKSTTMSLDKVKAEIIERDERDSKREIAPLKQAKDAMLVYTDGMSIDEVVDFLYEKVQQRLGN